MRRWLATVLLVCLVWLIPAGSTPLRLCLLDGCLTPFAGVSLAEPPEKCCGDCHRGEPDRAPCCVDLGQMPDSLPPDNSIAIPPVWTCGPAPAIWVVPALPACPARDTLPRPVARACWPPPDLQARLGVWLI